MLARRNYWLPSYQRSLQGTRDELEDALWLQLEASVRSRLEPGDVPGIILSGGIDSSAVAAAAVGVAAQAGVRPRSYSAVFPGDDRIDESERIAAVVEALDLGGVQLRLQPSGSLALALDYLDHWELPAPGPGGALEQPLVERAAEDGVNVILDGQGGDELFGLPPFLIADRLRRGRLASSWGLATAMLVPLTESRPSRRRTRRIWTYYGAWGALAPRLHFALRDARSRPRLLPNWLLPPHHEFDRRAQNDWAWKAYDGPRWWAQRVDLLTAGRERIGVADYLRHRAAVVGADARPPLLDVDLVELCLRLPPELAFDPTVQDRPLIRNALRGRVPEEVRLNRVKSNVGAFYYETLAGPDLAPIRRLLVNRSALLREYVDLAAVERILERLPGVGGDGWYEWVSAVWRLTTAETWLRQQEDSTFAGRMLEQPDVVPTVRDLYRAR
jgi:asparagine synthase (glutamine-hydrolysing)